MASKVSVTSKAHIVPLSLTTYKMAIAFQTVADDIYSLLEKLEPTVNKATSEFADISYQEVFNEKVQSFLASEGIRDLLSEYLLQR